MSGAAGDVHRKLRGGGGRCRGLSSAGFLLAFWACLVPAVAAAAAGSPSGRGAATTTSESSITTLAFGSCNKQYLPQPIWKSVEELSPDVWLWIGDAVYVDKFSDGGVEKMSEAIAKQLANDDYQRFLSKVPRVEGVWDDHDYGVNDAGKELSNHRGRVAAFLDFLGVSPNDPRRGGATLYSSHDFGEAPKKVRVILLDIRTQRDGYHAFNIAHRKFKFAAMIGALLRWFSSSFCLGSDYAGDMIGEDQWDWLEDQLTESDASVHVLVSTVQVLTSNPLVESWGHFPHSRRRLLDLLHRTNPAGLVLLSGDVHHAELASGWRAASARDIDSDGRPRGSAADALPPGHPPIGATGSGTGEGGGQCPFAKRGAAAAGSAARAPTASKVSCDADGVEGCGAVAADGEGPSSSGSSCAAHAGIGGATGPSGDAGRGVVEVTTSGMTHSCLGTHGRILCEAYLDGWRQHRWRDDAFYLDQNFGDIQIEWAEDDDAYQPAKMSVTVRDVNGTAILPVVEHFGGLTEEEQAEQDAEGGGVSKRSRRAAGFHPAANAIPSGTEVDDKGPRSQQEDRRERESRGRSPVETTFLDRSPPPECVEAVLPGGCTASRFSALGACLLVLVFSCFGFWRKPSVSGLDGMKQRVMGEGPSSAKRSATAVVGKSATKNGSSNGSRNGARDGS